MTQTVTAPVTATQAAFADAVERDVAIDFQLKRYKRYDQSCRLARETLMDMLRERSNAINDLLKLTHGGRSVGARFMLDDAEYRISTYHPLDESGNPTSEKILYFRRVFKLGQPVKVQLDAHVTPYAPKCG